MSIEAATTVDDGVGGQTTSWAEALTWWASARGVRGAEQEQRQGRLATVETYLMVGRYDPRITTLHRVNWAGRLLNIRSAQDRAGDRRETTLECEAGVTT